MTQKMKSWSGHLVSDYFQLALSQYIASLGTIRYKKRNHFIYIQKYLADLLRSIIKVDVTTQHLQTTFKTISG